MDWLTGLTGLIYGKSEIMTDSLTGPLTDMADMAEVPDMADKANSRVILPPMAYIDGKSEIMNESLAHSLTAPITRRCYRI